MTGMREGSELQASGTRENTGSTHWVEYARGGA